MPELSFLNHVARTFYGFEPQSIEALEPYCSDQRGIYRLQDTHQDMWMFRLSRSAEMSESLLHAVQVLAWLERQHYPAPFVRRTMDQDLVCRVGDWSVTVLTYVGGTVLDTNPRDLESLGQMLGRLHALPVDEQLVRVRSRCHPDTIAAAATQLAAYRQNVPEPFAALVNNLHAAMVMLQHQREPQLSITHGDCWHQNAIKTREGGIVLIDWDQSGMGLPLLDLGNLLFASHFNFDRPLEIEVDDGKIQAILHGYQQACPILVQNSEHLANTMRFLLAWQLGSYMADPKLFMHPQFPFVLQKLHARDQATQDIADVAVGYINSHGEVI